MTVTSSLNLSRDISYKNGIGSLERGLNNIKKAIEREYPEYEVSIDSFRSHGHPELTSWVEIEIEGSEEPSNELFDSYWSAVKVFPYDYWVSMNKTAGIAEIREAILEDIRKHEQERFED